MFRILLCLFLILDWCDLFAAMVCVILVYLHAYILLLLPAIESNENECTEEGGIFEYQEEEDQGQANQGKPSKLVASLPNFYLCMIYYCLRKCMVLYILLFVSR
jgi:hypothetical protein